MAILALTTTAFAQQQNNQKQQKSKPTAEQMQQMKIRHLINELALDDATAAKFTDVYKEYSSEMDNIRKSYAKKGKKDATLTDAEIDAETKARFQQSRKILDVREKYYDKFRKFLSARQVKKIYNSEQRKASKVKFKNMQRKGKFGKNGQKGQKPQKND